MRNEARARRRDQHDPAAGHPFAEVVVGVALDSDGDSGRQERAEALPRRALE